MLRAKRAAFVAAYLGEARENATEAARLAKYAHPHVQGPRLLGFVDVADAIAEARAVLQEQLTAAALISREDWLREVKRVAMSDARRMFTEGGSLLLPCDLDDDIGRAVQAIEVVTRPSGERDEDNRPIMEHVHKIRLHDKLKALELYGKAAGYVSGDGVNVHVNVGQFIGGPPRETREEWVTRMERERVLRLAGPAHEHPA